MKNYKVLFITMQLSLVIWHVSLTAQILNVPLVIQEQTNWCWDATSKCVLDYFGFINTQCTIAEYTRTVATWHSFGTTNCCVNANLGCNYWNYNWGYPGSIADILVHFGNLYVNNMSTYLSTSQIQTEMTAGRPFIFRWGWYSGGGHFLVGYGISGSDLYYMNPLPGYGYEISNYNWVVDDGSSHTWTHTQTLCIPSQPGTISGNTPVCQGSLQTYSITAASGATSYTWTIPTGWSGSSVTTSISTTAGSASGTIKVKANNSCGSTLAQSKSLTVNATPAITGSTPGSRCGPGTVTLGATASVGTINWYTVPSGGSSQGTGTSFTTPSISVTTIYYADATAGGCTTATRTAITATVNPLPLQPEAISGLSLVCQGSTNTYSIPIVTGATSYTWTLPAGWTGSSSSRSINAMAGASNGAISVTGNNSCGPGPAQSTNVSVVPVPVQASLTNINVLNGQNNCNNASQTITVAGNGTTFFVQNGATATMIAGQSIDYLPGTKVYSGGYLHGYLTTSVCCGVGALAPSMIINPTKTDSIEILAESVSGLTFFKVFPNPTTGNFILELSGNFAFTFVQVEVFGIRGEKVLTSVFTTEQKHEFSLSGSPSGIYFIRVLSGNQAGSAKIIKL
jgi:hypothetical protein